MKIIEFTESSFISYAKTSDQFSVLPTAAQQSCRILMAALEAVNQAGLDGKRLSKLELRSRAVYEGGYDIIHELHAKVDHRLQPTPPAVSGERGQANHHE